MPTEDEMTVNERRKYLKRMKPLYLKAKKAERSRVLTEMEQVSGLHRKSLSRLLHAQSLERQSRQKLRRPSYGAEVEKSILQWWESLDAICAERLTPALLRMAKHLAGFATLKLTGKIKEKLKTSTGATASGIYAALAVDAVAYRRKEQS